MVSMEDLKQILLLADLPEHFVERLLPLTQLHQFNEREVVYEEGERAVNFYMLIRGKILLEVALSETISISLGSIKSGYSFGWSSLLTNERYASYAVCAEPSEVLSIPGSRFMEILHQDKPVGYVIMDRAFRILSRRLDRRTGQFLRVLRKHPHIQKLLEMSDE